MKICINCNKEIDESVITPATRFHDNDGSYLIRTCPNCGAIHGWPEKYGILFFRDSLKYPLAKAPELLINAYSDRSQRTIGGYKSVVYN